MVVTGMAPDLNSLLSTNKVSLLPREKTSRPCIGFNNAEYERKQIALHIFIDWGMIKSRGEISILHKALP